MEIIAEYKRLTKDLAVINSKIKSKERDLNKIVDVYAPADCKGLDYSKPQVQSSRHVPDIIDTAAKIYEVNTELVRLRKERDEITAQRDELDKCIDDLGEIRSKIIMLKIRGKSHRRIAYELNYSERHINRIVKEIYENLNDVSEMSYFP